METQKDEYVLSMFEVCEHLNKSKRTVSRYIRKGLLHPIQVKSRQGTLEYRFSEIDVKGFKEGQPRQDYTEGTGQLGQDRQEHQKFEGPDYIEHSPQTRQDQPDTKDRSRSAARTEGPGKSEFDEETRRDTPEKTEQRGQDSQDGFAALIKRTVEALTQQLKIKDDQLEAKDRHIDKLTDKIGGLIERNKELNYLMKGLQDRVPMLEAPRTRKGRRPKQEVEIPEAEGIKSEETQPEARPEAQEIKEVKRPLRDKGVEQAEQQQAAEEVETPKEEGEMTEEKPKKKRFWQKLFTPYNLP